MLANRPVMVFRAPLLGIPPAERVWRTERILGARLNLGGPNQVTVKNEPQGSAIMLDGAFITLLQPDDVDTLTGQTLDMATQATVAALEQAIAETREGRDHQRLLRGLGALAIATVLLAAALWGIVRFRRWIIRRVARVVTRAAENVRVAGAPLVHSTRMLEISARFVGLASWLLFALFTYEWLSYALTRFPYTRAWGEQLDSFLLGIVLRIGNGILKSLPDLVIAAVILGMAKVLIGALKPIFKRVETGQARGGWLDSDMVGPTRRLSSIGIWLFAFVMAYPYLPGADSEAFKGVSVLVGLMLTLGGSSLIGQAASGLILMYSRTLRVGEYVRIGDQEGTVHELGSFTTKIRTGLGEEVSVPNALVLGGVTKNYSRTVQGKGYIVDTAVTIGYDTPWRQVEAMLIEAAHRTPGILADPKPRVVQTGLSDFYIEYRLIGQAVPSEPRPRAEVLNSLHGCIVDVFNEHGVQIMSPHYLGDPAQEKLVPRGGWYPPPARRPQEDPTHS
ncbi:mechanosensitive ion channel family protein [Variovorax sp. HJSM1_2]|uniref:mechanosensitive ion channel family protein n=1 Tax=Variovorax sp. HJSM1_2 TaxID=3366263 RepID=UPI003BE69535